MSNFEYFYSYSETTSQAEYEYEKKNRKKKYFNNENLFLKKHTILSEIIRRIIDFGRQNYHIE